MKEPLPEHLQVKPKKEKAETPELSKSDPNAADYNMMPSAAKLASVSAPAKRTPEAGLNATAPTNPGGIENLTFSDGFDFDEVAAADGSFESKKDAGEVRDDAARGASQQAGTAPGGGPSVQGQQAKRDLSMDVDSAANCPPAGAANLYPHMQPHSATIPFALSIPPPQPTDSTQQQPRQLSPLPPHILQETQRNYTQTPVKGVSPTPLGSAAAGAPSSNTPLNPSPYKSLPAIQAPRLLAKMAIETRSGEACEETGDLCPLRHTLEIDGRE